MHKYIGDTEQKICSRYLKKQSKETPQQAKRMPAGENIKYQLKKA